MPDSGRGPLVVMQDVVRIHGRQDDETSVRALDGISLRIERGEYVAITGESGSGKTTLLQLLCALDRPTSGRVLIDGQPLETATSRERALIRAHRIGIVFQGANLIPSLDALANVLLASRYARNTGPKARADAIALLRGVGLGDRLHHRPDALSGGQQQRVAIARALANDPVLLLADEPTGELDTKNAEIVMETFERLNRERGQTLIIVTHNPSIWARAHRVIRLADGKIVEDSSKR